MSTEAKPERDPLLESLYDGAIWLSVTCDDSAESRARGSAMRMAIRKALDDGKWAAGATVIKRGDQE